MRRSVAAAIGVVGVLATSVPLGAKGLTTRITIEGGQLASPIEITDPQILKPFGVWGGAGGRVNGVEQTEGFILDWSSEVAPEPPGLQRYRVSFHLTPWNIYVQAYQGPVRLAYIVSYSYDPASGQGYVYLPGPRDPEYRLNTATIFRGHRFEGHWFRATEAWQAAVTPLITPGRR